jgi:hypothetical protein
MVTAQRYTARIDVVWDEQSGCCYVTAGLEISGRRMRAEARARRRTGGLEQLARDEAAVAAKASTRKTWSVSVPGHDRALRRVHEDSVLGKATTT